MSDQPFAAGHIALKLIVVIVDRNKVNKVKEILSDAFSHSMYVLNGIGTAKSELLDVLGVGSTEKAIIMYISPGFLIAETIRMLNYRMEFDRPGMGIAFTMPLSGVTQPISRMFSEEKIAGLLETFSPEKRERAAAFILKAKEGMGHTDGNGSLERMKEKMENEIEKPLNSAVGYKHDLILAVINKGYSDEFMDSAKDAGAKGGTVIQARRTGPEEAVKLFGITLQAEKEIVAIITERENKKTIMKAVCQTCGLSTEAAGIVFSVPVDGVAGLGNAMPL